ncbi:MAG: hypothetical protein DMF72_08655 [Acidobacteria bacterium]|nr:MAG: hypothetical protein DMF72_08655 [Acidobacteriota bacterium]
MPTKASTIRVADLAAAVERAIAGTDIKKFPGGIIMGRMIAEELAKREANAAAKQITAQVAKAVPGVKFEPKVVIGGGITTMGFIFRPAEFEQ